MELLSYDFVQRGLLTGVMVGIASAIAGVFLILRRMAFLGAGLSHAAFGGIAISMLLNTDPFLLTTFFTLIVGNIVQAMTSDRKVPGDAAIALVFSGGVALAVIVIGLARGFGEDLFGYLFGNILMVTESELLLVIASFILVILFFLFFYKKLMLLTFSEEIARLRGVNTRLMNHMLVSVASLVIVLSIKVVGIILASSMIVVPALTALLVSGSFLSTVVIAVLIASLSVILGTLIAFHYDLPPSGSIVGSMIAVFGAAFLRKVLRP